MRQNKLLLLLALLMMAATGAWADTTVTWTASDLEETDLFVDFEAGIAGHNTIKGITVTASSGGNGVWQGNNISMDEGSTTITFTSSVGNIKSIAITAQSIYTYGSTPSGWTMPDYKNLSWSGDASPTVSMTLSDWWEIYNISEIVFTIESAPAPAASTYSVTLAEGTEDGDNWTISPTEAAEGAKVTVTYSGEKKVKSVKAVKKAQAITDLATITADYEAKDGETLTGTLANNVKISIADGAKVTLKDATINGVDNYSYAWAGITCAGDATITLEGTNTVKGFAEKYPGIFVSSGKTLIINGTGELNASSNGSADNGSGGAGIGGGYEMNCGNIEIQSGTVTATGNQWGAGIGGGYNASCGNITISGGTVTATGGEYGAGIGGGKRGTANVSCGNITISGGTVNATGGADAAGIGGGKGNNNSYKSSCGTIRITTGVTSVTATKGNSNAQSIGAGKYGTCGSVTIAAGANVTQK